MTGRCPTVFSVQSWQVGRFGRAQEVPAATGCPTAFEQAAPLPSLPEGRSQEREEPGEAMAPLAQEGAEAQQQIHQQRGPDLPAHGVGVVPEEVGQLERLFELLEEHLPSTTTISPFPLPHSKMLPRLRGDKKLLFPVSLRVVSRGGDTCRVGHAEASVANRSVAYPATETMAATACTSLRSSTPPKTSDDWETGKIYLNMENQNPPSV